MTELDAVRADASTPDEGVEVPLVTDDGETLFTVPPPGRWWEGAGEALRRGNFTEWARLALSDDDAELWAATRKRYDDIEAFFAAWEKASGENRGKSRPSPRSSRSTRKR